MISRTRRPLDAGSPTPVPYFIEDDFHTIRTLVLAPDVEIRLIDPSNCCDATLQGDLTLFAQNIGRHLDPQPP